MELLHSRYLDHVKQASRTLGLGAREVEEVEEEEVADEVEEEVGQEVEEEWSSALDTVLWREKCHVEEKLRCIQDDHFYELLQVNSPPSPLLFLFPLLLLPSSSSPPPLPPGAVGPPSPRHQGDP